VVLAHQGRAAPIPEKTKKKVSSPEPGSPTNSRSKVSGGGGERDKHHSHIPVTEADQPREPAGTLGEGDESGLEERRWKSLQPSNGFSLYKVPSEESSPGNDLH
jgi:hypothetical protein